MTTPKLSNGRTIFAIIALAFVVVGAFMIHAGLGILFLAGLLFLFVTS